MENQNLTFEQQEYYLLVTSHGVRSDFKSVVEATLKINEMAGKTTTPFLLMDYRKVKFNLPITNAFDLIRIYESQMTHFKNITIASIITDDNIEIAELWRELSQKRGFRFMTFTNIQEGEDWLIQQQRI